MKQVLDLGDSRRYGTETESETQEPELIGWCPVPWYLGSNLASVT